MAPEQCRSSTNVDDKADVYSLGVILFQMLSGRLPFDASDTMQLLYAHVHEPPPSLATVVPEAPAPLVEALTAMLAKQPQQRPTMAEVAATMARLGGTVTGHVLAPSAQPNAPTLQMSSLASISQAVGEVGSPAISAKSNAPLMILLGVVGFLVLGGIAAIVGVGFFASRWVHGSGAATTAAVSATGGHTMAEATGGGGAGYCGRFAKLQVPKPAGFGVQSCMDGNGIAALSFVGESAPSVACAPMKRWANGLGWTVDADTSVESSEATMLHRGGEQLTVACSASGAKTMVVVSLSPRAQPAK
jgi:hypothetical protein